MLAVLRLVSVSEGKMQKKVQKQTMKISCMCTFQLMRFEYSFKLIDIFDLQYK
jgi:hypothetical protein